MPWTSLASRLLDANLPKILAGPILRSVDAVSDPASVTVWLALRVPTMVTLDILHADGTQVDGFTGTAATVAIGANSGGPKASFPKPGAAQLAP